MTKGYTEVAVSEHGSFDANKAAMDANTYDIGADDNSTINNLIICLADTEYNYSLTEDPDDVDMFKKYTSVYTLRRNIRNSQFTVKSDGTVEYFNSKNMGYFTMKQESITGADGRVQSCNQCAFDLLIQNSQKIINKDMQCSGTLTDPKNKNWVAYNAQAKTLGSYTGSHSDGNGVLAYSASKQVQVFKEFTGLTWTCITGKGNVGDDEYDVSGSDVDMIVKFGGKDIKDMTKEELRLMFKVFYNNDYFVVMGIREGKANGPADTAYKGGHVVLFAGCDADSIYINDSSPGAVKNFTSDDSYKDSPVRWISVVKCSDVSTKSICGGGDVKITTNDRIAAESLGIEPSILEKSIDNEALISSYCKLMESDLESVLDGVNRDNLTGDQLDSLKTWEDINADSSKKGGVLYWIRLIMMWLGIALVVWAVLLYVSFWFDRANNFIDISFVTVLTLGKLTTSETDEEYTFGDKNSKGIKTINSRILTKICVLSIVVGALIISGTLYTLIAKLVNFVMTLIAKGG
jgi:hypothetical protein